jgi:threonine/homoserine/homoserine lactone efflux protein
MSIHSFLLPENLLLMFSIYFVGTASPGPSNMSIMALAIQRGRASALVLAAGVITGSIIWGLLVGFGLATALLLWANVLVVLKLIGGLYLLWLAYKASRSALSKNPSTNQLANSFGNSNTQLYLRGVAMHLTNPKAIFSWAATISVGLPNAPSTYDILTGLFGCFALGVMVFFGYAVVFSTKIVQSIFMKTRRWFEGVLAVIYGYAGIRLLLLKT